MWSELDVRWNNIEKKCVAFDSSKTLSVFGAQLEVIKL